MRRSQNETLQEFFQAGLHLELECTQHLNKTRGFEKETALSLDFSAEIQSLVFCSEEITSKEKEIASSWGFSMNVLSFLLRETSTEKSRNIEPALCGH